MNKYNALSNCCGFFLCIFLLQAFPVSASGEIIRLAVAANFGKTIKELAMNFESNSDHQLRISLGSTAALFNQIRLGAPFDLFLSADELHPALLADKNLADLSSKFTYACGQLAIFSNKNKFLKSNGMSKLKAGDFRKLAIANPLTAPYGKAAKQVLERMGVWESVQKKMVLGTSVAQAYHFVASGNVEIGFVSKAQVSKKFTDNFFLVPNKLYDPIRQDVILLRASRNTKAAQEFLHFLESEVVKSHIQKSGYKTDC